MKKRKRKLMNATHLRLIFIKGPMCGYPCSMVRR